MERLSICLMNCHRIPCSDGHCFLKLNLLFLNYSSHRNKALSLRQYYCFPVLFNYKRRIELLTTMPLCKISVTLKVKQTFMNQRGIIYTHDFIGKYIVSLVSQLTCICLSVLSYSSKTASSLQAVMSNRASCNYGNMLSSLSHRAATGHMWHIASPNKKMDF